MAIRVLKSEMNRDAALRRLSPSSIQRWLSGPLRAVAEIHIPYRLYKITVQDRGSEQVRYYAVDAASGKLDPYEFQALPEAAKWIEVETRNSHPIRLSESDTQKLALEKIRRILFSSGFFRLSHPQIAAELLISEFYLPYWAGFYGDEQNVSLKIINALRQTFEGSKVRHLVKSWLSEKPADDSRLCAAVPK
jgi:hypothetical protein